MIFFLLVLSGCSVAGKGVEKQVLVSLQERIRAGKSDISIDSIRLIKSEGSSYAGYVYLSSGSIREQDSVRVKSELAGLEYDFPKPGPLLIEALP